MSTTFPSRLFISPGLVLIQSCMADRSGALQGVWTDQGILVSMLSDRAGCFSVLIISGVWLVVWVSVMFAMSFVSIVVTLNTPASKSKICSFLSSPVAISTPKLISKSPIKSQDTPLFAVIHRIFRIHLPPKNTMPKSIPQSPRR